MDQTLETQILDQLSSGPQSATQIATALGLSRQTVHSHLVRLAARRLVASSGRARATRWRRAVEAVFNWPLVSGVREEDMWQDIVKTMSLSDHVSPAAYRSLNFAITEMLNNAIDHSDGTYVAASIWSTDSAITIQISDDGVGVFQNVRSHFKLNNDFEAIAHLAKGKQTSAPAAHSGQGIFFSSRVMDDFMLTSHDHTWLVHNAGEDQAVRHSELIIGTRVDMTISKASMRVSGDVFGRYSDPETLEFRKTDIPVALSQYGTEFVSRSEAKRLAEQLELFGEVDLDFRGVEFVGQGFVDELFRVWLRANPGTKLVPINMNEEVAFMVNRGLPNV